MYRCREFERYVDESSFIRLEWVGRIARIIPGCCARMAARELPRQLLYGIHFLHLKHPQSIGISKLDLPSLPRRPLFWLDARMNKPNKRDLMVSWEEVEDPDFAEHLRRVFDIIISAPSAPGGESENHKRGEKEKENNLGQQP
jgi:hypothetical protein